MVKIIQKSSPTEVIVLSMIMKRRTYAKIRNGSNQNTNLALKTKTGNNQNHKQPKHKENTPPIERAAISKNVATQQTKPNQKQHEQTQVKRHRNSDTTTGNREPPQNRRLRIASNESPGGIKYFYVHNLIFLKWNKTFSWLFRSLDNFITRQ